jgi:hypothetical protein
MCVCVYVLVHEWRHRPCASATPYTSKAIYMQCSGCGCGCVCVCVNIPNLSCLEVSASASATARDTAVSECVNSASLAPQPTAPPLSLEFDRSIWHSWLLPLDRGSLVVLWSLASLRATRRSSNAMASRALMSSICAHVVCMIVRIASRAHVVCMIVRMASRAHVVCMIVRIASRAHVVCMIVRMASRAHVVCMNVRLRA